MNRPFQPNLFFNAQELERKPLLKKDWAIFSAAKLNLVDRKVMNALLLSAQATLKTQDSHFVTVRDLAYLTGFESHHYRYLEQAVSKLKNTTVRWNILGEDWHGEHSLLAGYIYKRGLIEYSFDPLLKKYFLDEYLTYTKLRLAVQKRFKRAYSIPLYEVCQKYFDVSRKAGETPFLEVDDLRSLFGLEEGQYQETKALIRGAIKPALTEINQHSDLYLEPPIFQRRNRRIVGIKFRIRPNPLHWDKLNPYGRRQENAEVEPESLFLKLTQKGVNSAKARELVAHREPAMIENAFLKLKESPTNIKNVGGWLVAAIEAGEGWNRTLRLAPFERPFADLDEAARGKLAAKLKAKAEQWRFHFPGKEIPKATKRDWVERLKAGEALH